MGYQNMLDREFTNYIHFTLCYVSSNVIGRKIVSCNCKACPIQSCKFREERRKFKAKTMYHRRKTDDA